MAELQKDGHLLSYSVQFDVDTNDEIVSSLQLEVPTEETLVGIEGDVVTQLNVGIEGVTVKLFNTDFTPVMHTITDENGRYIMTGVEPGNYYIFAVKDGYSLSSERQTTIVDTVVYEPSIVLNEYPTGQRGVLYGIAKTDTGEVCADINVTLYSNGELRYSTLTADDGEYIIYGIEPGEYTLESYNTTFKTATPVEVTVVEDVPLNQDIVATNYTVVLNGTINGIITEKTTRNPIENAFVALYKVEDGKEVLITGTLTDDKGRYFFGDVKQGTYLIKAKSNKVINPYS